MKASPKMTAIEYHNKKDNSSASLPGSSPAALTTAPASKQKTKKGHGLHDHIYHLDEDFIYPVYEIHHWLGLFLRKHDQHDPEKDGKEDHL